MSSPAEERPWYDPWWDEPVDKGNALRARLRRHQGWWRQDDPERGPAGPLNKSRSKPVVSMLATSTGLSPNLMTDAASEAAETAINRLKDRGGPGLIQRGRLERNLLSSQPLCFNLFGHLAANPPALLTWVQSLDAAATQVVGIDLEIAPTSAPLGGSAFDAFVEYEADGRLRFLGIECKYAESLATPVPKQMDKYLAATKSPRWVAGAAAELFVPTLRQFWFNTLLVHAVLEAPLNGPFDAGTSVVVAMEEDEPAQAACKAVSSQLGDSEVRFSSIQQLVRLVTGEDAWKQAFSRRYLDLELSETRD